MTTETETKPEAKPYTCHECGAPCAAVFCIDCVNEAARG